MKKATITETKNNFSAFIHAVRDGETIIVTDRAKPVARIEAIVAAPVGDDDRLDRLQQLGVVLRAGRTAMGDILETPPPQPVNKASAVEALLSERKRGR